MAAHIPLSDSNADTLTPVRNCDQAAEFAANKDQIQRIIGVDESGVKGPELEALDSRPVTHEVISRRLRAGLARHSPLIGLDFVRGMSDGAFLSIIRRPVPVTKSILPNL